MEFYSLEVKRLSYQKPKDHKNRLTKPRLVGLRTVVKAGNLGRAPNLSFLSSLQGRACYSWQGPSSTTLPIGFLIFLSHTWQLPSLRLSWSNNKGQILDSYFRKFKPFPGSKPWALIGIHLIHNQHVCHWLLSPSFLVLVISSTPGVPTPPSLPTPTKEAVLLDYKSPLIATM